MAPDCSWKLNTNNVVYLIHACYCSLLSFLYFCFSSISNFLSPKPSCLASPLLPLNWSQLSHSILSFSPLSGPLVAVGLSSDRIYGGPIYASVGLCASNWFLFFFSFLEWWWWCSCGFVIWLQFWWLGVVVLVGGDSGSGCCGYSGGWMGFVSNEFLFFYFFIFPDGGWWLNGFCG